MDFRLNAEEQAFRAKARDFARTEIAPHAARWDAEGSFPLDTLKHAAAQGFAAIYVHDEHGGAGFNRLAATLIFEELAAACPSTAAYLSIHNMVAWMIDQYGSPDQREHWIPKLARMEALGSYCMSEPDAGSDLAGLHARATREGDEYVLNGVKSFVSGGGTSDIYLVLARTGGEGARGVSCFLVEKNTPGLSFGAPEEKLGWRAQPTAMVKLENCRVPVANRVGAEGAGFKIAMAGLDGGRVNIGACSVGGARACLEAARLHIGTRSQFGRKLSRFQALQFKLADMATALDAARLLVRRAARTIDFGHAEATMYCAMAKRFAADTCFTICDDALQLHGGYGYIKGSPVERYLRDLRVHRIMEGTSEIMRVVIARRLLAGMEIEV